MVYNTLAEIREMRSLLKAQQKEHEQVLDLIYSLCPLGSRYPASVQVLQDKVSDIEDLLDELDDQEEELTGIEK